MKAQMIYEVDKDMTTVSKVSRTKEALKQFRAKYSPEDIARLYAETFNDYVYGDILRLHVDAFPSSNLSYEDRTTFRVEEILFNGLRFLTLHFYIDSEGTVTEDELLHGLETYKRA